MDWCSLLAALLYASFIRYHRARQLPGRPVEL